MISKPINLFYDSLNFSQRKYSKMLSEVFPAKVKCSTPLDCSPLKRFDVLQINDEEKLIVPFKPGEANIQYLLYY